MATTKPGSRAPSPRRAWAAVFSVAAGTFVMVTTEFLPVGLLPRIAAGVGVSLGHAGWLVTVPGIVAAVTAPVLAVVAGRVNRRALLLVLTSLIAVSNILCASGGGFGALLIGRVLLGACVGGFWAFAATVGRQLVPEGAKDRATAIVMSGISAGTVVGLPFGATLGALAGWRSAFGVTAAVAAAVAAVQVAALPSIPVARSARWQDLIEPFRVTRARAVLTLTSFLVAGYFAGYTFLTPFLSEHFRQPVGNVSALLLVYGVSGFLGTFVAERLLKRGARVATLGVAWSLAIVMLGGLALPDSFLGAVTCSCALGLAFGAAPVCLTASMFDATAVSPEAGQAVLVVVFQLALAAGSVLGGVVVDRWGVEPVMAVGGSLIAAGIAAWRLVESTRPAARTEAT
jgi:predicted MFS family arabinose efflux permease